MSLLQECIESHQGGFKTNIALGADPEICEITKEMEEMAIKASKAMGGGILGIDMMEDEERGNSST